MPQRTLYQYFVLTGKPRPPVTGLSFLDLPYDVRRRIYVLAGLIRLCPIDMNREGQRTDKYREDGSSFRTTGGKCYYPTKRFFGGAYEWREDDLDCICPPLPHRLLYVSHAISKECSQILYSNNRFKICRSRHGAFSPLHNLSRKTLALLTSLSVRLNACSCFPGHSHKKQLQACTCHFSCKGGRSGLDKPLDRVSRSDRSVMSDWKHVCSRISKSIRPCHLRLYVVCDTADYDVAIEVIEPLLKMQTLRDCSIRLGQAPNHELRRLAQKTVSHATGTLASGLNLPHCSTDLPVEIQQQILAYTDLVAPHVLQWEPNHGLTFFECCRKCTDALEVCCCSLQHAAFSRKCICWKMPTTLFLISSSLREEAIRIFYQRNHFAILPQGGRLTYSDTHPTLLQFLVSLPTQALRYVQSIECLLPVFGSNYLLSGGDGISNWLETINFIANSLVTSNLTLTLNISDQHGPSADCAYMSQREILDREIAMWATYRRIIEPMAVLKGLRNLFIHISWPVEATKEHIRNAQEHILERRVMGVGYDSNLQGKFAPRRPWWNESDEGTIFGPDGTQIWPIVYYG